MADTNVFAHRSTDSFRGRRLLGASLALAICLFAIKEAFGDDRLPAKVEVEGLKSISLEGSEFWEDTPLCLKDALVFDQPKPAGREVKFKVNRGGVVLLAASWAYDGNPSGGWRETRWTFERLVDDGWVHIGKMMRSGKKGSQRGLHELFYRVVKDGEAYNIHTRKYNSPYVIIPDQEQIASVLKARPENSERLSPLPPRPEGQTAVDLSSIPPRQLRALGGTKKHDVAMLAVHEVPANKNAVQLGILLRELVRQSLLISARDELGLPTRDAALREHFPVEENVKNVPLEVISRVSNENIVGITVFRRPNDKVEVLWDEQFRLSDRNLIEQLAERMEKLSRTEFVKVWKKAGFEGQSNKLDADGKLAEGVDSLLVETNFIQQFAALRKLHTQIREEGESPYRLATLVLVYSNLSLLTDFHISSSHKVFMARALLYAQRIQRMVPDSPGALWVRAYARALSGRHHSALEDLAEAERLVKKDDPTAKGNLPNWAVMAQALCVFDRKVLIDSEDDEEIGPLARLLNLVMVEHFHNSQLVVPQIENVLERTPDCYRVFDLLTKCKTVDLRYRGIESGPEAVQQHLYQRLVRLEGFPDPPRNIVIKHALNEFDSTEEYVARGQLLKQLRDAGGINKDKAEPSWGILATLVEDLTFTQAWRFAYFSKRIMDDPIDEFRTMVMPAIQGRYPDCEFINCLAEDKQVATEAVKKAAQFDPILLPQGGLGLLTRVRVIDREQNRHKYLAKQGHGDAIARDLHLEMQKNTAKKKSSEVRRLLSICPNSPVGVLASIRSSWETAKKNSPVWEEKFRDIPDILFDLGEKHVQSREFAPARRCLRRYVELSPDYRGYNMLAISYRIEGDMDQWVKTLEEFTTKPSPGLKSAQVNVKIVDYYFARNEWEKAIKYADRAAESGAAWALQKAAWCHERLGQWEKAEQFWAKDSQFYQYHFLNQFYFCYRTNKGDKDKADEVATGFLQRLEDKDTRANHERAGLIHLLMGNPEKAMDQFEVATEKSNPYLMLHVAMLADQVKDKKKRDAALARASGEGKSFVSSSNRLPKLGLAELASVLAANWDLKPGEKLKAEQVDGAYRKCRSLYEQFEFVYFMGRFYKLRGNQERSLFYWNKALRSPDNPLLVCTFICDALIDSGIDPYKHRQSLFMKEEPKKEE